MGFYWRERVQGNRKNAQYLQRFFEECAVRCINPLSPIRLKEDGVLELSLNCNPEKLPRRWGFSRLPERDMVVKRQMPDIPVAHKMELVTEILMELDSVGIPLPDLPNLTEAPEQLIGALNKIFPQNEYGGLVRVNGIYTFCSNTPISKFLEQNNPCREVFTTPHHPWKKIPPRTRESLELTVEIGYIVKSYNWKMTYQVEPGAIFLRDPVLEVRKDGKTATYYKLAINFPRNIDEFRSLEECTDKFLKNPTQALTSVSQ